MRFIVALSMLCAGCRCLDSCHNNECKKPLKVDVVLNYTLPEGGSVQLHLGR